MMISPPYSLLTPLGVFQKQGVPTLKHVREEIGRIQSILLKKQSADGSWRFCLESGPMTDTHMIILLRTLGIDDEALLASLARHIASKQQPNGSWKLYPDEAEGNLSATLDAYYALLFTGRFQKSDPRMEQARQFILAKGGLNETSMLTKINAALTGQYQWPKHFIVPVEIALLPANFPLSFYDFVGYARVHLAPMMIFADRKYVRHTPGTPDLSDLLTTASLPDGVHLHPNMERFAREGQSLLASIHDSIKLLPLLPAHLHELGVKKLERFILQRIEPDGTLYNYSTSTYFMIFALLAQGYSAKHPVIVRAIKGLTDMIYHVSSGAHLQLATSAVWDTALLANGLQKSGLPPSHPAIALANSYLLQKQQTTYGDWHIRNPGTPPGGWGFSDQNTMNPDIDDTTAALRSLYLLAKANSAAARSWKRGVDWLLSMQNDDGGWPAFERNTDSALVRQLPIEGADTVSTDPSAVDLTGRTLEFLGNYAGYRQNDPRIKKAVQWMLGQQQTNGTWYGRWGIAYVYGTWAAITGLMAIGVSPGLPAVQKAVQWLLQQQNPDGGWGESCRSDEAKTYIPLGVSTPSQTAWAIDALIAVSPEPTSAMNNGIGFLLQARNIDDWTASYPTGGGRPGGTYFHYHSYRWIWPLLTLSHYHNKYGSDNPAGNR